MARLKKTNGHSNKKKEIKVELIPVYISDGEFQEKKKIVQNLIARMCVSLRKRGRPPKEQEEDFSHAA